MQKFWQMQKFQRKALTLFRLLCHQDSVASPGTCNTISDTTRTTVTINSVEVCRCCAPVLPPAVQTAAATEHITIASMAAAAAKFSALRRDGSGNIIVLDQSKLPAEEKYITLSTHQQVRALLLAHRRRCCCCCCCC